MEIEIPHNFAPRKYQLPLLKAMDGGFKRAYCVWHRRAGKDKVFWNYLIRRAFEEVGVYYYFFPTYTQGKKILWDGIDNDGFRFTEHAPKQVVAKMNDQEMKLELINGSIVQIIGTDKYDAVRGTNPKGCIFSEYAFQNPMAWEVVRPILAANGGFAMFNTTPNGKNHAYKLFEQARASEQWFVQVLTADDTEVIPKAVLDEEQADMSREMFLQEYFCSFDVGMIGSIYGEQMETVPIERLPIYPEIGVYVVSDLGLYDSTALWFFQQDGKFLNAIHYYESRGKQAQHYFAYIQDYLDRKNTQLAKFVLPHDSKKGSMVSKETVLSQAQDFFGGHKIHYKPIGKITERIDTTRRFFPKVRIDEMACSQGIECLQNYKYKFDDLKKVFGKEPEHDWASHGADGFGYAAEYFDSITSKKIAKPKKRYHTDHRHAAYL